MGIAETFKNRLFDGRYQIREYLGQGSWGEVVRAFDRVRSHDVALKLLKDPADHDVLADRFFHNEFRAMTQVEHPNIVRVFDFGQSQEGIRYYTMEVVSGEPLSKHKGKLEGSVLEGVFQDLCHALSAVHAKGCLHCDVKPDNVILSTDKGERKAVLMDFGLNIELSSKSEALPRGTVTYAAPEMLAGQEIDARADIYSLGITLLEVITGELPFKGRHLPDLLSSKSSNDAIAKALSKVRAPYKGIIAQMTAADPRDRFPSCHAVLAALSAGGVGDIELGAPPPVHRRLLRPDLVGRSEQLRVICGRIDRVKTHEGGCILIEGPKGSGKTRLLQEGRYYAQLAGLTVVVSAANMPVTSGMSMISALEKAVNLETPDVERAGRRERLIQRIVQLAKRRPLVILIDGIQNLDWNDIRTWCSLAHRAASEGFLLISSNDAHSAKNIYLRQFLNVMADEPSFERCELQPLSAEEVSELCRSMIGSTDPLDGVGDFIFAKTGGNVGACVRLLSELATGGRLKHRLGRWSVVPDEIDKHGRARRALHPAIRSRSLPSNLKTILLAAAINGPRVPASLVQRVAGLPSVEFAKMVHELEDAGILGWEMANNTAFVRFTDPSHPRVIVQRADPALLSEVSRKAAEALLAYRAEGKLFDPLRLVDHLRRAGRIKELIDVATAEAKRLRSAGELSLGVSLLTTALGVIEALPGANVLRIAGMHLSVAEMRGRLGEVREALGHCQIALSQLEQSGLRGDGGKLFLAIQIHSQAGQLCENLSDYEAAIGHYESALSLLRPYGNIPRYRRPWVNIQNHLAWAQMLAHNYGESDKTVEKLLSQIDEHTFPNGTIRALSTAGWLSLYRGNPQKALELFQRGIAIARRNNLPAEVESQSVNGAASASWHLGNWTDALSYYQRASSLAERLRDPAKRSSAIGNLAVAEYQLGKLRLAEMHFREGLGLDIEIGDVEGYVVALNNLGTLLTAQGRNDEARKLLGKARRIARSRGYRRHTLMIEGNLGELLINEGKIAQAESLLRKVLLRARRNKTIDLLPEAHRRMAAIALRQGSRRRFNYYAAKCRESALAVGETHELLHIDRLKAHYFASRNMFDEAEDTFKEVASSFASNGAKFEEALTKLEWAEVCLKAVRLSQAGKLASGLEDVFKEAGANRALARVRDLQKQIARAQGWPEKIRRVLEAFQGLHAADDVEAALQKVADTTVSITGADRGVIIGLNRHGMIQFEASANLEGIHQNYLQVSSSILRHVKESRKPLLIDSAATDSRFLDSSSIRSFQIGSVICVPVFVNKELQAVLYIDSEAPNLFDEQEHIPLTQLIAHHVGLFLENVRMANENELVEELVASLAHEMRTPLNAILSSVELMLLPTTKSPTHYVGVVSDQVARLSRLADETIDLIKGKSASRMLSPQKVHVNVLIRHVAEALESLTHKNKISLKLELSEEVGEIIGQPDALEQVLINLLSNAIKYTRAGGTITMRSRITSFARDPSEPGSSYLYLGHRWEGTYVTVSVVDDGEGMDEAECKRIFDKYARTRKTEANHRVKGSGLGLYICRSIIEQHGGRIWATSQKGKGTNITFTLPVAQPSGRSVQEERTSSPHRSAAITNGLNVL